MYTLTITNTANRSKKSFEFGSFDRAFQSFVEKCDEHNIAEDDIYVDWEEKTVVAGGRGYDVIMEVNINK